jgi:hypothetical protein
MHMRNRLDHLAKELGKAALGPCGTTVAHDEISPETMHADLRHVPAPSRRKERERLGLLGRISAALCLIEIYGHAPNGEEFRACLAKHLAFWQQRSRQLRASRQRPRAKLQPVGQFQKPFLWIIAAGVPITLLTRLELS